MFVRTLIFLLLFAVPLWGQAPGNPDRQERGDLEWRRITKFGITIDDHPAVYNFFTTGDPRQRTQHLLIEMEGPTDLIQNLTLQQFFDDNPTFHGAYMRSGGIADREPDCRGL